MGKPYQGHRSYNVWNVALWFHNDEGLYRLALTELRRHKSKDRAARAIAEMLDGKNTPDGVPYTYTSIRAALVGM